MISNNNYYYYNNCKKSIIVKNTFKICIYKNYTKQNFISNKMTLIIMIYSYKHSNNQINLLKVSIKLMF